MNISKNFPNNSPSIFAVQKVSDTWFIYLNISSPCREVGRIRILQRTAGIVAKNSYIITARNWGNLWHAIFRFFPFEKDARVGQDRYAHVRNKLY